MKKSAEKRNRKENSRRIIRLAMLGLFAALVLLMSFTPLGYLKVGIVEITFLAIPVAVGAALLGAKGGALLGTLFGVTSLIQAAFGMSAFGAALFAISPVFTVILCLVPRILMGWLAGLLADLLRGKTKDVITGGAACLSAPLLNTVLFTTCLILCFWNSDYIQGFAAGKNVLAFAVAFVGLNGLIEAAVSFVVGTAISAVLLPMEKRLSKQSA